MTIKIVLRKRQNKDGTRPLILQITKDRVRSIIHLGYHLKEADWDATNQRVRKSYPNSTRLNNILLKRLSEAHQTALQLESTEEIISSKKVKQKLKPVKGTKFFAQADLYLEQLKKLGKHNQYSATKPRIKRFQEFLNNADIPFQAVTVPLLERFKVHLQTTRTRKVLKTNSRKPISERTVINHLAAIRSVFGFAIKNGVAERRYSPFGEDKIVIKFPDSLKIGLTAEDVQAIENLSLEEGSTLDHARNLWLLSFYFAGMRASDLFLLKWSDFQDNRLYYSMGKNEKPGSLKVPEKAVLILRKYRRINPKHNLVFHFLTNLPDLSNKFHVQKRIASAVQQIDKYLHMIEPLANIEHPLTLHIARHTFGNISGDKIPIQMLQKLYRHTSITTTIGYQSNFIHKDTDEALNSVINF